MIENYMEEIIGKMLPKVLKEYPTICTCEKCIDDIKALTLNKFMPLYVASQKGILYSKMNELEYQFKADVLNQLIQSINKVSKNPRHDMAIK